VGKTGRGVLVGVAVGKMGRSLVGVGGSGWKAVGVGAESRGTVINIVSGVGGRDSEGEEPGVNTQLLRSNIITAR